jgi:hypothetical protein
LSVAFFLPTGGGLRPGEPPAAFAERMLAEIRLVVPVPPYP